LVIPLKFGQDSYHTSKGRPTLPPPRERALKTLRESRKSSKGASNRPCTCGSVATAGVQTKAQRFFILGQVSTTRCSKLRRLDDLKRKKWTIKGDRGEWAKDPPTVKSVFSLSHVF